MSPHCFSWSGETLSPRVLILEYFSSAGAPVMARNGGISEARGEDLT